MIPAVSPQQTLQSGRASALGLVLLVAAACSETSVPITVERITTEDLMEHISFLADDSLYGRAAGWEDELTAATYVRDRFAEAGLAPGVDDFMQQFWIGEQPPLAVTAAGPSAADDPGGDDVRPARPWSQNVIGLLPGQGALANEWVLVGAHYDHVGWALTPDDALMIYNGADDNASGTAVLLEVARHLSELHRSGADGGDRRSLMFLGFGAEEIGLEGSNWFCANPTVPLDRVAAMVNLDMVGRLRDRYLTVGAAMSADWWPARLTAANLDGLTLNMDDKYLGGSDHYCFVVAGRPAVHLFTGLHAEYHTPLDDPPLINQQGLLQVAELTVRLVRDLTTRSGLAVN
jgi:hypothetical protein